MAATTTTWTDLLDVLFEDPLAARCLVAPDGTILRANAEWLRSTGFTREVVGEDIIALFPEVRDVALALHARARAGHRVAVPRRARILNGRETGWEETIEPIPMQGGTALLITARGAPSERERFRAFFVNGAVGAAEVSLDGRFTEVNDRLCRLTGYSREELLRMSPRDLTHPDDRKREDLPFLAYLRGASETFEVEKRYVRKDGTIIWVYVAASMVRDAAGVALRSAGIIQDVTQRKQAEEALRRYEVVVQQSRDIILFIRQDDGRILEANPAATAAYGYSHDELLALTIADLRAPDTLPLIAGQMSQASTLGALFESTHQRKGGSTFPVEVSSRGAVANGTPMLVSVVRDITERKRASEALRHREEEARAHAVQLEAILDSVADGVIVYDQEGRTVRSTPSADAILGVPGSERRVPIEDRIQQQYEVLSEEGRRLQRDEMPAVRAAVHGEIVKETTLRVRSGELEPRWLRVTAMPLVLDGQRTGAVLSMTDVTRRKRAEEALRRTEAILQYAGAMAHLGAWWVDISDPEHLDASTLRWSEEVFRIFGYEPGSVEASYALFFEHVHPEDRQRLEDAVAQAMATRQRYVIEHRILRRDGSERLVLEYGSFEFDRAGRPTMLVGALQDITESKKAEIALREAARRKDEFLGMLSHELRNPLAPIRASLYLLDHAEPTRREAHRARDVINRQVGYLTRLVDDLLDVTRITRGKVELRRADLDLAALVRRTADDYRRMMQDRGLELAVQVRDEPIVVNGDETRLAQVFGNLLSNAAKFTPAGGRVMIAVHAEDGNVEVRVRDTGPGIAPDVLPSLFEPFTQAKQTLARTEGGLGLGLALVKGFVSLHGGEVNVVSGSGAEFVVKLPVAAVRRERQAAPPPGKARAAAPVAHRRVLVVDDNEDAAETLAEMVRMLGHDAEVAYDGPTAVERAGEYRPDLVLCDIGLPGMDGYGVARALRAARGRDLRLVAISGYAQPEDVTRAVQAGFDEHLAKPCSPEQIERLLS